MKRTAWVGALAIVAACGGGSGSGSSGEAPAPPAPPAGAPPAETPPPPASTGTEDPPAPAPPAPPPAPAPVGPAPPVKVGAWTFWSAAQGLTSAVRDVSADDAGNVYVAAGEAVFAKRRADEAFLRFDAKTSGLTEKCFGKGEEYKRVANPPVPASMCPAMSVAGTSAGKAVVGYKGVGTDSDADARWAIWSGGADVVAFDGTALRRERHVHVASPPETVCEQHLCRSIDPACPEQDVTCPCAPLPDGSRDYQRDSAGRMVCAPWGTWADGRIKMRQIQRIVVNRTPGLGQGDVIFGGQHGSFAVLVAKPQQRGWVDYTTRGGPEWADARYVFEHEHPSTDWNGLLLTGETWALAVHPATGVPWFANQFRTTNIPGYATRRIPFEDPNHFAPWWGNMTNHEAGYYTFWRPEGNPTALDAVQSLSFCDDGTLWVGSLGHGLARVSVAADGATITGTSAVSVTATGFYDGVYAVACDPSDRSVWVGLAWGGGVLRLKDGAWQKLPAEAPAWAHAAPVRSIQIDRTATPRIVYVAYEEQTATVTRPDGTKETTVVAPGGVAAYAGP